MTELPCPTSHWPKFSALLDAAMDLPESARTAWLDSLTGDDVLVRPWLARVLGTQGVTGTHTGSGFRTGQFHALVHSPAAGSAFVAGDRFGPYCLQSLLGEGGMGEVWRATRCDDGPQREVALKLPHADLLSGSYRQRFARERDLLANLSHSHIAQLYDAGSRADGHPYLALELVQGQPITEACHAKHAGLDDRIELVLQVLQGLAYAHQRLIVHRDIKPTNVLVTEDGTAKLLDFGIAKLLHADTRPNSIMTQPQARLSTPAYSAPEQLTGGTITVATDLFSVGVLLFELCTGHRPFARVPLEADGQSAPLASQRADAAASGMPDSRKTVSLLRGDLDAILAKAVALDPTARYASAEAFAADLHAWRKGLPVRARRIGRLAMARKFFKRNRVGVALAAVLTMTLCCGVAGIAWQAHRAEAQAARANAIKDFLVGLFKNAFPKDGNPPSSTMTARDLLDAGASQADTAFEHDPATEIELLATLGSVYDALRESARSQPVFKRKLDLSRMLYGPNDARVLDSAIDLAWNDAEWSRPQEGAALLDTIRQPILSRYGDDSLQWAQWLEVRAEVSTSMVGGGPEALADISASARILERRFADSRELVDALFVQMECQFFAEAYPEAAATGTKIRHVATAQGDFDAMDDLTLRMNEAGLLEAAGRLDDADASYKAAQATAERVVGRQSNNFVDAIDRRANLAHLRGDRLLALGLFRMAAGIGNGASPSTAGSVLWVRDYPAALVRDGRPAEAVPLLEAALKPHPEDLTLDENRHRNLQAALGDAYDQLGRTEEARGMLLAVLDAAVRDGPASGMAVLAAMERWARFLEDHGELANAAAAFKRTLDLSGGAASAPAALAAAGLARLAMAQGDLAEAGARSLAAADMLQSVHAEYDVRARVDVWLARANYLTSSGHAAEARTMAAKAVEAAERYDAPESVQVAHARKIQQDMR